MSTYCTKAQIEERFGATNVDEWADLGNSDSTAVKNARIADAIAIVSEEIDDVLRTTRYKVPCVTTVGGTSPPTPTTIRVLAAGMAAVYLFEARGSQRFDPNTGEPYHRLTFVARTSAERLEAIRSGKLVINARTG